MERKRFFTFLLVSVGVIGFDRLSKWIIKTTMELGETIDVIGNLLKISYILNSGIAFGLLDRNLSPAKRPLLIIISFIALGIILYIFFSLPKKTRLSGISMGLIFGGAIGNIIDRIARGEVIDFIDVDFPNISIPVLGVQMSRFATFNLADSSVLVGIIMLLIIIIIKGGKAEGFA
jgi:signal peptidase II